MATAARAPSSSDATLRALKRGVPGPTLPPRPPTYAHINKQLPVALEPLGLGVACLGRIGAEQGTCRATGSRLVRGGPSRRRELCVSLCQPLHIRRARRIIRQAGNKARRKRERGGQGTRAPAPWVVAAVPRTGSPQPRTQSLT